MPPPKRRPKVVVIQPPTSKYLGTEPQDYTDPLLKLGLNPEPTLVEKVVDAANKATNRAPRVKRRPRVEIIRPLAQQKQTELANGGIYTQTADPTPAQQFAQLDEYGKQKSFEKFADLTSVSDVTVNGMVIPETGKFLESIVQGGIRATNSIANQVATLLQSVSDESDITLDVGNWLKGITTDNARFLQEYEATKPSTENRRWFERTGEFLGESAFELPKLVGLSYLIGPVAAFGANRALAAKANGENDEWQLAKEFTQGTAEALLLHQLGKTTKLIDKLPGSGKVIELAKKGAKPIQVGVQFGGGVGQVYGDSLLHPGQHPPDWLDYLHGGVLNAVLDPMVVGSSARSRKATAAAVEVEQKPSAPIPPVKPKSYNQDLPASGISDLRPDFWQPKDQPWSNAVTTSLIKKARVQYTEQPGEPEGSLYVNPQAALLIDRMMETVNPGRKFYSEAGTNGVSFDAESGQRLAGIFQAKAEQLKETIRQLPDNDARLQPFAEAVVVYESVGETFQAATAEGRPLNVRFAKNQDAVDPRGETYAQRVLGHESFHSQQHKLAARVADNIYSLTRPGWIADHPIGAKLISNLPDTPLANYDPIHWTAEAVAYAAQPGEVKLGLTKQERGVLVGDYLADVMDKHGPAVMGDFWAGRMDREVARVAFRRLYEANRVKYAKDPVNGRLLGLEWQGVEPPRVAVKDVGDPWGPEYQPPLVISDESKVRDAEGRPIAVYHGTQSPREIRGVDPGKFDKHALYGPGFYTTQDAEVAGGDGGYAANKFVAPIIDPYDIERAQTEKPEEFKDKVAYFNKYAYTKWSDQLTPEQQATAELGYGRRPSPHAYKLNLDIRNPFDVDAPINLRELERSMPWDKFDEISGELGYVDKPAGADLYRILENKLGDKAAVNKWLAEAGYDGITHIGGQSTPPKEFATESDAREYAAKTGGVIDKDTGMGGTGTFVHGHRVWIAFRPEQVINYFDQLPLSTEEPDPDYDAVDPTRDVGDAVTIQPTATRLNRANATPEIQQRVTEMGKEFNRAKRELTTVRGRLTKNRQLQEYSRQLQRDMGFEQPEVDAEIAAEREHLQNQYEFAKARVTDLKRQHNQFFDEIAGKLADNKTTQLEQDIEAAKQRIRSGAYKPNPNDPFDQTILSQVYIENLSNIARDVLIAAKVPILPKDELGIVKQLVIGMKTGVKGLDVTALDEAAEKHGLTVTDFYEQLSHTATAAGRALNTFSQIRKGFNKLFRNNPEIQAWLDKQVPTMAEIRKLSNAPGVYRQVVNLHLGAMVTQLGTSQTNAISGEINALGGRTLINLFDQVTERAARAQIPVEFDENTGDPTKFQTLSIPPISAAFNTIAEFGRLARFAAHNPGWFNEGVRSAGRPSGKWDQTVRLMEAVLKEHGEASSKLNRALGADIDSVDVQDHLDALKLMHAQALAMTPGARRTKLVRELGAAIKRQESQVTTTAKALRGAQAVLHKALVFARAQERLVRTQVFMAQLDYYAKQRGLDLLELERTGKLSELPGEIIDRATEDALYDTYASRPDPYSAKPFERWLGQTHQFFSQSDHPVAIAVSGGIPFTAFMGNMARWQFDHSPFAFAKIMRAENRGAWNEGNRQWAAKAFFGTAAWVAAALFTKRKYDELDRTGVPQAPWYSVAGRSVRGLQFAPMLFAADYYQRMKRGLQPSHKDLSEAIDIMLSVDLRGVQGAFGWLDSLTKIPQDENWQKSGRRVGEEVAKSFGDWWAAFATPLDQFWDLAGEFDKSQREIKDQYGLGAGTVFAPILNKLPSRVPFTDVLVRDRLPDRIDPFTGMPMEKSPHPFLGRQLTGLAILPPQSYPARVFQQAGIRYSDWIPFVGVPEVDHEIVGQVGKLAGPFVAAVERSGIPNKPFDEQVVDLYERFREFADDAKDRALNKFPKIRRQLEDAGEFNRWEQNVENRKKRLREAGGVNNGTK
jgi:hypothetical protein